MPDHHHPGNEILSKEYVNLIRQLNLYERTDINYRISHIMNWCKLQGITNYRLKRYGGVTLNLFARGIHNQWFFQDRFSEIRL